MIDILYLEVSRGERSMPRVIAAWKKTSRLELESSTWQRCDLEKASYPGEGKEGDPVVGDDVHPN